MLDSLRTAIVQLDERNQVRQMNRAAEQYLGGGRERVLGSRLQELPGIPGEILSAAEATRADHAPRHLHECRVLDGLYDCTIQALEQGHLLLELHDVRMEQRFLQLRQREVQTGMLDLLRRNLGHELRNPLGGIRGAAQMMATELQDDELGTLARLIMREVDRIDELIQRFGQPQVRRSKADIHQVIDEAVELLQAESGGSVHIRQDYDPSIPELPGDASALRQVLLNLLRNAQQAGASEIGLRTRVEHGTALLQPGQNTLARIDVEDDGSGVPEALRPMLFLPLVTGRRDGTGLGLALAQQIAAAHGGLLSCEALAVGSRFSLSLPLIEQDPPMAEAHG
jgi:two-component system nitrogen regulation sensor histidine kinase GlnL